LISLDEALAIVCAEARPLGTEPVPVIEARRRTLAEPVIAEVDSPPADVSAMDGYALRDAELADGRMRFTVAGESFPAAGFAGTAGPGECVRIFTGAPIPQGLDRVVIQENVRRDGDVAVIETMPSASRHIRTRGSDFTTGEILLKAGRLLDARALVAAAGADLDTVTVWRRPQISVLGTGDELVEPGRAKAKPGAIPESLSPGVAALAADWGGALAARYRLRDDPAVIEAAAAEALEQTDLVVVTGGASVGEKDFAKSVFARLGLELLFSQVAIRPGKPVWFGRARGKLVIGLPGNPTSALVTARLLLAPLVAGLAGRDPARALRWFSVPLAGDLPPCGDRETLIRGQWSGEAVAPLSNQDSGSQKTIADADLLIRHPAGAPARKAGERVTVLEL